MTNDTARPAVFYEGMDFEAARRETFLRLESRDFFDGPITAARTFDDRDLVDAHGNPIVWRVWRVVGDQVEMSHNQLMPCAVDWCEGHSSTDLEDSWEHVQHRRPEVKLFEFATPLDRADAAAQLVMDGQDSAPRLSVVIHLEGSLGPFELAAFADELEEMLVNLRLLADTNYGA